MAGRRCLPTLLALLLLLSLAASAAVDSLLQFKGGLSDPTAALASWTASTAPCKKDEPIWAGILCNDDGTVYGLRLENMSLSGALDMDALASLPTLRSLSLMSNGFQGPMPEVRKLDTLRALYLSMNQFSGEISDDAFSDMVWLKKVYLSQNKFSGTIPSSLAQLPKLLELELDNNSFEGPVPDFRQQLKLVNLANNILEGPLPESLSKISSESFSGNKGLCGKPLDTACKTASDNSRSSSSKLVTGVVLGIVLAVAIISACLLFGGGGGHAPRRENEAQFNRAPSKKGHEKHRSVEKLEEGVAVPTPNPDGSERGKRSEQGRFIFLKEDRQRFELQDLLKATAEVLGTGNFGCTYKASLQHGPSVVVKRFKDMNRVGKEDFEEHMRRMGRLSHPNLLPLVAYFYKREEKLFVTDHVPRGNLANLLHGKGASKAPVDWSGRLRIVKGLARGLAYLYEELQMLSTPHGHLKSSNVLLDESLQPLMTDYALLPVLPQAQAAHYMEAYKSPESKELGRTSKKSDMWCFGMLILEIVTGKTPASCEEKGAEVKDLVGWVKSKINEGKASEVFHKDMKTDKEEREVIKLLRVALACCEESVNKRMEMEEVLDKILELRGNTEEPSPRDKDELNIVTI